MLILGSNVGSSHLYYMGFEKYNIDIEDEI